MVEKAHPAGFWPSLYDPFRSLGSRVAEWIAPLSDASGTEKAYTISIELPGVEEKDVELSTGDGVMTVKGEKKSERTDEGETWFFAERQYGSFSRSYRLPADADASAIDAALKDGVLTVTIPKRAPEQDKNAKVAIRKG